MTTTEETHGHEVLQMMMQSGKTFSRATLIEAIDAKFGPDARFYICSGSGMTAAVLVDTLTAKGKFMGTEDAFEFNPAKRCSH